MTAAQAGIGCIVLAAGSGSRFGSDKRLAKFGTDTLLAHTLANIAPAFSSRILVLRAGDEALGKQFSSGWHVIFAADADKGMGHSLAAALRDAMNWEGAVVALADMPFVQRATFESVRTALAANKLVVPYYREQRGNPVGIGKNFFADLMRPVGDEGARALLQKHAAAVLRLEVEDPGILQDVDTPAALTGPGV